ncbi:hypothetical protein AURDEDRAFT_171699 [Auricularia subglabra TFB-10046 SS5]|nr:hypothetical protein AURDEDRAFT_171699 [Auricularia subglabra TFB-10046 SS5]
MDPSTPVRVIQPAFASSHATRLPIELFHFILDNLHQPDVLVAASVCRTWRSFAIGHRNHYAFVSFRLVYHVGGWTNLDVEVSNFCETLRLCCLADIKLSIHIDKPHWPERKLPVWRWGRRPTLLQEFHGVYTTRLLPALTKKSLDLAVKLDIWFHYADYESVYSTLRLPTPRLAYLSLASGDGDFDNCDTPLVPIDLFCRKAPLLRTVRLRHMQLPSAPVMGLRYADDADVGYCLQPLTQVFASFPHLRRLCLRCDDYEEHPSPTQPFVFPSSIEMLDLHLRAHEMSKDLCQALECHTFRHLGIDLSDMAKGDRDNQLASSLRLLPPHLSLIVRDLSEGAGTCYSLTFTDRDAGSLLVRSFYLDDLDETISETISIVRSRIVEITIPGLCRSLEGFFVAADYPELESLTIDVLGATGPGNFYCPRYILGSRIVCLAPSIWRRQPAESWAPSLPMLYPLFGLPAHVLFASPPEYVADCPKLRRVALCVSRPDVSAFVGTQELAHFARDLGLLHPGPPTVTLSVADRVSLVGPYHTALSRMFSNDLSGAIVPVSNLLYGIHRDHEL